MDQGRVARCLCDPKYHLPRVSPPSRNGCHKGRLFRAWGLGVPQRTIRTIVGILIPSIFRGYAVGGH